MNEQNPPGAAAPAGTQPQVPVYGWPGYGPSVPMAPPGWGPPPVQPHHPHAAHAYYPMSPYGYPPGWGAVPAQPAAPVEPPPAQGLLNNRFVMGMLVGGALTYVLTNESVQRAVIRGAMQLWLSVQSGVEETKERFRDAESEIRATRGE